ncbi:hypothetical protein [Streptomyces tubercidicus]|uniref:Uncharacterized protein n=1 Tax=Streptomyces tubercidicus TaxID=47759 RepID=A0A640V1W8_9ACTN|nr:hypothetical protein [Streptomyces tubercidicus]WAU15713.1 hypothetical protein STRTU_006455 [Streptomyces tubercidicus]GFE41594.1 hypothetical protein Stube_62670 [Streptomyces tubercidicus]
MKSDVPLPLAKCAFDDPATRRAYQRDRRKTLINLLVRLGVWVALLIVAKCVESDEQLIEGLAAFLLIPMALLLIGPSVRLLWLYSLKNIVLVSRPWQRCEVIRRRDTKVAKGFAVEIRLVDEEDELSKSPVMGAFTGHLHNRWPKKLEEGTWFAGTHELGGVIARPGGQLLMRVVRR